jgi:hypothetical protein
MRFFDIISLFSSFCLIEERHFFLVAGNGCTADVHVGLCVWAFAGACAAVRC